MRASPLHGLAGRAAKLGLAEFVLFGALACAAGLPRQVVAFLAGASRGAWAGAVLALAAQIVGCLADLLWARLVARPWVQARLRGRLGPRLARLDGFLAAHPFGSTLTLRLLPVGNNLVLNLLAGAFGVRPLPFLAASALGYLPQTMVFCLLGAGVQVGRGWEIALALLTLALSIATGLALLRRHRRLIA